MKLSDSSPEFRFQLGSGLNFFAIWLFFPSLRIQEDFDHDTDERGITHFDLEAPSRLSLRQIGRNWSFSLRFLGFGFTLSRSRVNRNEK